jgi:hypothetical protein
MTHDNAHSDILKQNATELLTDSDVSEKPIPNHVGGMCEPGRVYLKEAPVYDAQNSLSGSVPVTVSPEAVCKAINACLDDSTATTLAATGYDRAFARILDDEGIDLPTRLGLESKIQPQKYEGTSYDTLGSQLKNYRLDRRDAVDEQKVQSAASNNARVRTDIRTE